MNVEKMMHVANRAKTIGQGEDYALSNAVFAILLEEYFRGPCTEPPEGVYRVEMGKTHHLEVNLETRESEISYPEEVHYDILTIIAKGEKGESLNSICIPVPVLYPYSVIAAIKCGKIVERGEHQRNYDQAEPGEMEAMWKQLLDVVPQGTISDRVISHLDDANAQKILGKVKTVA